MARKRNSSFTEFFVKTSPKVSRGARAEALLFRPCLQQFSIHGAVLIRKQIALACLREHGSEEGVGDFAREQTLAVLREHHHIPNRVVHVQADLIQSWLK